MEPDTSNESTGFTASPEQHETIYSGGNRGFVATESPASVPSISPNDRLTVPSSDEPVPVVKVLSVRGVEYLFMSIFLWLAAGSFIGLILALINGQTGFSALSFPLALLLVSLPGFGYLFIRLKKAELVNPALRLDASKRRLSQITQLLAFITCLANLVTLVYVILQKIGGSSGVSLGKTAINCLVIFVVAGGILVYYWNDEHRQNR